MKNEIFYSQALLKTLGKTVHIQRIITQGGGCINNAVILETDLGRFFMKVNDEIPDDMFQKDSANVWIFITFTRPWCI